MDPHMKGVTSESKCCHRDSDISKTFTYVCFQMTIFQHCGFHLNRD